MSTQTTVGLRNGKSYMAQDTECVRCGRRNIVGHDVSLVKDFGRIVITKKFWCDDCFDRDHDVIMLILRERFDPEYSK